MDSTTTPMYMPVAPANYGGGFGNFDNGWWIILLFLFAGGFGGFNGNGGGFVNADIQRGFDQNAVMGGVGNLQNTVTSGYGDLQTSLCGGFASVNAAINNGFAQAEIGENARQTANLQQMFSLQSQMSQCCCDNRLATVQTQNIVQNEGALTRAAIQAQTQSILDKMCQQEIDDLKGTVLNLQNQLNMATLNASQLAQTQQIIAALTPAA
ncbi:MAG: hypothetical protein J6Y20_05130 [Lachnospiraceae bacterium]|nr:hypothetical protein [Lachnospiraceae bacterium]